MRKLGTIMLRAGIVVSALLVLYLYLPVAKQILTPILRHIINASDTRPLIGSSGTIEGYESVVGIFFGLVSTLFIFIIPPIMTLLLAWKTAKRVGYRQRGRQESWWRRERERMLGGRDISSVETTLDGRFTRKSSRPKMEDQGQALLTQTESMEKSQEFLDGDWRGLNGQEWFEMGKALFDSGQYEDAVRACTNAIERPSTDSAYFYRGMAYRKIGNKRQALRDLKAAARFGHEESQRFLRSRGIAW